MPGEMRLSNLRRTVVRHRDPDRLISFLWCSDNYLELTHSWDDPVDWKANNGNEEPHRGFGHIAFHIESEILLRWKPSRACPSSLDAVLLI